MPRYHRFRFPEGMQAQNTTRARLYDAARVLVTFLGLYQGAVPLIVRLLFGAEQRFAPALWLPAPWWWIACLGIVAVMVALLTAIHAAKQRLPARAPTTPAPAAPAGPDEPDEDGTGGYDALSALVLLVAIYNGIAPFVARLVFDGDLFLAFTLRLPSPWWWIASLAVLVAAVALLGLIDRAKQRRAG